MRKIPLILMLCGIFFAQTIRAVDFVHISEIFYNTSLNESVTAPSFSNGEYIELFNAGHSPVNLEGWVLRGDGAAKFYEFGAVILPPHSFLILAYRHNWSPGFELSEVFTDIDEHAGQIIYQNRIRLRNTRDFIRLYDPTGLLRDSIYYGNVSSIQPISSPLTATNSHDAPASEYRSVQRKIVEFDERGVAVANHLHWYVDVARPFELSPLYVMSNIPLLSVNETASFTYDAAGNRITRTIVLRPVSLQNIQPMNMDEEDWWRDENPFSDVIDEFQVHIHPNPTHGRLMVEIDMEGRSIESIQLMVVAQNGVLLLRKQTTSAIIPIDLVGFPRGNYTLHITINGISQHYKIVKL